MSEFINSRRMRTWAQIDLDNIEYNYSLIRERIGKAKLCCVVKANGYGHGAVKLSALYEKLGADYLAVSNIEEALQLRQNGITLPLLILGYTPAECAKILAENDITQCVYSLEYGKKLAKNAQKHGVRIKIHLKLDTGMGRIGFLARKDAENELDGAIEVCRLDSLIPEGIFTHFALADEKENGKEYTNEQFECFIEAVRYLEDNGVKFEIKHCANSAATLSYPEYHLDMVRAGLVLYGLAPSQSVSDAEGLRPAMKLLSVISHVKELKAGETVSYGRTFTAPRDMRVATVPAGYADGLPRSTAASGYRLSVGGKEAEILGRICMDQLMLDVSEIKCKVGDIVTIFGEDAPNSAYELAAANDTINYEIVCGIGERVPRAYVRNGRIIDWNDSICK